MNDKVSNWVMSSSFAMMLTIGMAVSTSPYASSGQPASNTEKSQHSIIDNRSTADRQQNIAVTRQETDRSDHSNKQNNK